MRAIDWSKVKEPGEYQRYPRHKINYPIIPPKYEAAVLYACERIRETSWFNVSVSEALEVYDLCESDREELERHIRARQAAGQRKASRRKGAYTYRWYSVEIADIANGRYIVDTVKANNENDAIAIILDKHGINVDDVRDQSTKVKQSKTKRDAEAITRRWADEL